ncbi:MAG TPA: flagellin [Chloroflexota bacterium]|nr:flagellin [Chloroflexota bacterium]
MVRINSNIAALTADRNLTVVSDALSLSTQKLSSGLRINLAKDDSAGLVISEKLRAQIRATDQASRNAQDGVSLIQTADGALDNVHAALQRLRELTVQAANGTVNAAQRSDIGGEVTQLLDEMNRIATTTRYAQLTLFATSPSQQIRIQVGGSAGERLAITFSDMQTSALGLNAYSIATPQDANASIALVDAAIDQVTSQRAGLGGAQNALEGLVKNLNEAAENLRASESRIRDLDVANETVAFTKWQVLSQAGTAVLAQANVFPQSVLQLLRQ